MLSIGTQLVIKRVRVVSLSKPAHGSQTKTLASCSPLARFAPGEATISGGVKLALFLRNDPFELLHFSKSYKECPCTRAQPRIYPSNLHTLLCLLSQHKIRQLPLTHLNPSLINPSLCFNSPIVTKNNYIVALFSSIFTRVTSIAYK